jgi:hypothetical protein
MIGSYNDIKTLAVNLLAKNLQLVVFYDPTRVNNKPIPLGFQPCAELWEKQHLTNSQPDAGKTGTILARVIYVPPIEAGGGHSDMSTDLDPVDISGSGCNAFLAAATGTL